MHSEFNESFACGLNDTNIWTTSCKSMRTRCWLFFKLSPLYNHPLPTETGVFRWFPWWSRSCFLSFSSFKEESDGLRRKRKSLVCWGFCRACCGATVWCFWNKSLTQQGLWTQPGQSPYLAGFLCDRSAPCGAPWAGPLLPCAPQPPPLALWHWHSHGSEAFSEK